MIIGTIRGIRATVGLRLCDLRDDTKTPCVIIESASDGRLFKWMHGDLVGLPFLSGKRSFVNLEYTMTDWGSGGTDMEPLVLRRPAASLGFIPGRISKCVCIRPEDLDKIRLADPEPMPDWERELLGVSLIEI